MKPQIGTVIHATMRSQDLIPAFIEELEWLGAEIPELVYREQDDDDPYWSSEDADWDLESLFDALNEIAPPYCYFGSHCGDGSDYGFWPFDDVLTSPEDWDLTVISDWSQAENDGEYIHVSDHGNVTLGSIVNGKYTEIWSIV